MNNIDEFLQRDFCLLSDEELIELEKSVTKVADAVCYQMGVEYNIKDVSLINRIDEQLKYFDLAMMIGFKSGSNFVDSLGTIGYWDSYIYRELLGRNVIVPSNKSANNERYDGGYVKEPKKGIFDWAVSFDLASLYPNILIQNNMSPETIVENVRSSKTNCVSDILSEKMINERPEYTMAANGVYFRKDKVGILPEIAKKVYEERKDVKSNMLKNKKSLQRLEQEILQKGLTPELKQSRSELKHDIDIAHNLQMALKIMINSLYGSLGSNYFRWYDIRIAEGITLSGQLTVKWAEKTINEYMNKVWKTDNEDYVLYIDTDSNFANMEKFITKFKPKNPISFLDTISSTIIAPQLEKGYRRLFDITSGMENRMDMKREKICKGFWTGKKRYVLAIYDNEGVRYETPKISITGIEAVKSSTPAIIRDRLKNVFKIILDNDPNKVKEYIEETRKDFMSRTPEEVAFPRGVSELKKYEDRKTVYKKGTPIHCKAAILFNKLVDEHKIGNKYYKINGGDKILWLYLKLPNPLRENVIGFTDELPKEFDLHSYVDYETQFEKTYLNVMTPILDSIGWENLTTDSSDLDAFF